MQKTLILGKIEGRRRSKQQDKVVGWHHLLNEHAFEQTPGDSEEPGSLACCSHLFSPQNLYEDGFNMNYIFVERHQEFEGKKQTNSFLNLYLKSLLKLLIHICSLFHVLPPQMSIWALGAGLWLELLKKTKTTPCSCHLHPLC